MKTDNVKTYNAVTGLLARIYDDNLNEAIGIETEIISKLTSLVCICVAVLVYMTECMCCSLRVHDRVYVLQS